MSRHVGLVDPDAARAGLVQRSLLGLGIGSFPIPELRGLRRLVETNGRPEAIVVILTDDMTGLDVAAAVTHAAYDGTLVIVADVASDSRLDTLRHLCRARFILRPKSPDAVATSLVRLLDENPDERPDQESLPGYHGIVGRSSPMMELFSRIEKIAATEANVCIYGESGTGKELIARAIHYASSRRNRPLITLDCTTIPEGLMESHLFGHVKGAFTGAIEDRHGVFSLAKAGTVFMDELGELKHPLQAKLLRVIQTREFVMVGGTKRIQTDVRLITATNKDLKREVQDGRFRDDLYYRVAVCMIEVPPLRRRRDDIPDLVEHFLKKFSSRYGKPIVGIESSAMERIMNLTWPGNVRQLENFLEQAVVMAEGDLLAERDFFTNGPMPATRGAPADASRQDTAPAYEPGLALDEVRRRHILGTLSAVGGNRTEAASVLGISVRCLQYKLKEYARRHGVA